MHFFVKMNKFLYYKSSTNFCFKSYLPRLHTYIHNWPLQSLSQNYGLASHTNHDDVCFNFIREGRDIQFNVYSERWIFARNLLRKSSRKNIFFIFRFDAWRNTLPTRLWQLLPRLLFLYYMFSIYYIVVEISEHIVIIFN